MLVLTVGIEPTLTIIMRINNLQNTLYAKLYGRSIPRRWDFLCGVDEYLNVVATVTLHPTPCRRIDPRPLSNQRSQA